ncbi:MAG: lipopolysaccharide heptosyltransferase I [Candidatus Muirbacterium halophilum]|nr:lipopolysaccharide heptosyltransferase I [Candidatus Muirbacterium halophilum]MCK9474635.1 lipopolysaccharide heptosyltransferase I [Candidatus Muirbacterium halophilum]
MSSKTNIKIAIIRLSSLGDIIHSLWTLQFIKKQYPQSHITWVCDKSFENLVKCCPQVDKIISIPLREKKFNKSFKILKSISKDNFDYVIDMQGLLKSAIVSRIISSKVHGFCKKSSREKLASFFYKYKYTIPYKKNIYLRNLDLINQSLKFTTKEEEIINYSKYLISTEKVEKYCYLKNNNNKNIIFIPSATTPERVIPIEKYIQIINLLDYNCYIIYGNNTELKKCQKIKDKCQNLVILPKLSIAKLISIFSYADCIIGPDTGPSNVPTAIKVPSITIYWDKARNSFKRNTLKTKINKSITFKDFSNLNINAIIKLIYIVIKG